MAEAVDLKGAMGLLKKSKNLHAPIFEAITNSFEAIAAKEYKDDETPYIKINFYYTTGLFEVIKKFSHLEIIDNGIGFDEPSFQRYRTLLDKSKGFKNRGSGRVQFLHRFDEVEIRSVFIDQGNYFERRFRSDEETLASNTEKSPCILDETGSTIILRGFKPGTVNKESLDDVTIEDVQSAIKNKFLLKLYLDKKRQIQIVVNFYKNQQLEGSKTINSSDIAEPTNTGDLEINYLKFSDDNSEIKWIPSGNKESLQWAHWKLPENELSENGIFLCSKNVAIQSVPFLKIKKNEVINGFRHLTVVYGEYLDRAENVNDAVDKFTIPTQREVEREAENVFFDRDAEYIFIDKIEEEVKKILPDIYTELKELKAQQDHRIEYFAELYGVPMEIANAANIDISDSNKKIVEKIFKKQAEVAAKENYKIQEIYESLIELNPTDPKYQAELGKKSSQLLELIPQQNKNELSRYVIRREMVTKILGLILKNSLAYQNIPRVKGERTDKEALIHDLVFKRKKDTEALNDLWILNEEFVHYSGYSDTPLNQIVLPDGSYLFPKNIDEDALMSQFRIENRKTGRPDIFLFPEDGKCILVEFKAHDIDLSDHLNQLTRYCNLIANTATQKIDSFYCYLIGQVVSILDLPGDYLKTVNGDYVKPEQAVKSIKPNNEGDTIGHIYQEVVVLSNIEQRASRRNKSFADKLGIRLEEIPLDGFEELVKQSELQLDPQKLQII
ncbi:hypothetical protein [Flavihumibacter sp. CACIAM 22H1]|uniref:hypothetical protein n=1 Tax=Flavihumibacter sp. CACIAM 22H1 TaxID=1812911 RepID=UPI0007A8A6CC|nr:hypothetical protein [Flavihumibacter sp. CACIAM 22H1]KYP13743.1 MAG: hypothetical protein A1D16_04555 [Flavihumibacter sp. CACIAM 22H1]